MTSTQAMILFRLEDKPYAIISRNLSADQLLEMDEAMEDADLDKDALEIITSDVAEEIVIIMNDQKKYSSSVFAQYSGYSEKFINSYIEMAKEPDAYTETFLKYKKLTEFYVLLVEGTKRKMEGKDLGGIAAKLFSEF